MQPDYDCLYQYVFVRKDMPKHYHIIQTAHAVQQATLGIHEMDLEWAKSLPIHLILFEVNNEAQLNDVEWQLTSYGIRSSKFYEPDYDSGFTALACELMKKDDPRREFMRQFRMYR